MNSEQLKDLLLKAVTDELNEDETAVLNSEAVPGYSFSEGFKDNVLIRIRSEKLPLFLKPDFLHSFDIGFRRVALTGVAAILVLAVSLLLTQGSLSYDTLLGIDSQVDDSLISLLVNK